MSLIIALGSNLGNSKLNLIKAQEELSKYFSLIKASQIYRSEPVDYFEQPDFLNQVLEYEIPKMNPDEAFIIAQDIEHKIGKPKEIEKGPRLLDIDFIFWGFQQINSQTLIIPHPEWNNRSFVVRPLMELPFYQHIKEKFKVRDQFDYSATPL